MSQPSKPALPKPREVAEIRVVGAPREPWRDVYHWAMRLPWLGTLAFIIFVFLSLNALFGLAFTLTGGIAGARPGNFLDAFFFSVQTMGTIGYGAMYPKSMACQTVMVTETVVGIVTTALATGLVFAKFSRSTARIAFTKHATISLMNNVPTLAFRVGNERGNLIVEAQVKVTFTRTEKTDEGMTFYRLTDLLLSRDRSSAMSRTWTILHPIVPPSPLAGMTPATFITDEVELMVSVVGTDDTSLQPVHARHTYYYDEIIWGARPADVLSEAADGHLELDVRKFNEIVKTPETEAFPYSWKA
jgi:inward rectifier potassium channel